jgi:hypothetical protein
MDKLRWLILACALFLGACVVAPPPRAYIAAPPPDRVEVVPTAPGPNHFWIRGHWGWENGQHVWIPGHWEGRRGGSHWVPAQWVSNGPGWDYVPGHWERN